MPISTSQAQNIFTTTVAAVFEDNIPAHGFGRSFFPSKETGTKLVDIRVRRNTELVAVDVVRGSEGNRNTFSKSTLREYLPPYYREYFDLTELDAYDQLWKSAMIDESTFTALAEATAKGLLELQKKIERGIEKQAWGALVDGIIPLINQDNIDYKRKAGSLVDTGAGTYWATGTVSPFADIQSGCEFLRQEGLSDGVVFNLILGKLAFRDMMNNTIFKAEADIRRIDRMSIREPQRNSVGATSHGYISVGDYIVNIWTYPQGYRDASDNFVYYMDQKKMVLLPENPDFITAFGMVPQLPSAGSSLNKSAFVFGEKRDEWNATHMMDIKSAPLVIPVAVDQIYTRRVVSAT